MFFFVHVYNQNDIHFLHSDWLAGNLYFNISKHKNTDFYIVTYVHFLARLHEVHRAIAVTPVVHVPVCVAVPVPVSVTNALKFSRSPYLDNHSSESIHTWTIDTL